MDMSKSLTSLFKRAMWMIQLWFQRIADKKQAIRSTNLYFSYVFVSFSPFLCSRVNGSRSSLLICSFLKCDFSDLLPSLITTERPWAIAHIALKKRAKVWFAQKNELITLSLFRSQKTRDLLEKPMSEFLTLVNCLEGTFYFVTFLETELTA